MKACCCTRKNQNLPYLIKRVFCIMCFLFETGDHTASGSDMLTVKRHPLPKVQR